MSQNRNSRLGRGVRVAGAGAAAAVALGLMAAGTVHADVTVPLPDGEKAAPGALLKRTNEQAIISPSLAANGAGRVVWVSGRITADVKLDVKGEVGPFNAPQNAPGTNNSSTHGTSRLSAGYIVGCQVALGDFTLGGTTGLGYNLMNGALSPSLGISGSVPLRPGEVKWVQIDGKDITKKGTYHVAYKDQQMELQGCAGFAQARSYAVLELLGEEYTKYTLFGQPFSIG